jgi:ribosomal-protein-alanine N-acetyltransferase
MQRPIETPRLRTQRLVLRAATPADAAQLLPLSVYDGVRATDELEAALMLEKIARDQAAGASVHWAIALPDDEREIVGTCGFYRGLSDGQGEIGYLLKEQHRGHGFMTEAVRAIVGWGFAVLALDRIVAFTDYDNVRSRAVLTRVGFAIVPSDGPHLMYRLTRD